MANSITRFAKFSWGVLVYNILVILFGAYVRASGSGAGCGAHWPLCNGVVIPRPQRIETIIEFTHRITSGFTLILVILLVVWAWRSFPKGSRIRTSSMLALFFTITEALVGAGLVLFELVEHNTSVARAISMMVHLVNTFLLVASIAVTAWWSSTGAPRRLNYHGLTGTLLVIGALAILVLGASGAVTALGDTLYPSSSLSEGLRSDFSETAHWMTRLRILHPGIAVSVGLYLALVTLWVRRKAIDPRLEDITLGLFVLYGLQVVLGLINVALLAPIWMQIVHLLFSNLVWITFILMSTVVFSAPVGLGAAITNSAAAAVDRPARLGDHELHDRVNQAKEVR